jgi:hypothetical protein
MAIAPFSELIEQNHSLGNDAPRSSKYDGLRARATSGDATALPMSVMNLRWFIPAPKDQAAAV